MHQTLVAKFEAFLNDYMRVLEKYERQYKMTYLLENPAMNAVVLGEVEVFPL